MTRIGLEYGIEPKYAAVNIIGSADLVAAVTAKKIQVLAFVGILGGIDATFKLQSGASTDLTGIFQHSIIPAVGTLTLTGQPLNTETVVLDGKTYTFQDTLTDVDGNVHISHVDASGSIDNLIAAIILGVGAGTAYADSMTVHPSVTAIAGAGDTMAVTAHVKGTSGNSIASTETLTNGSFGGATLASGVDGSIQSLMWPYNPAGWCETVAGEKLNAVLAGVSPALDGMLTYAEVT